MKQIIENLRTGIVEVVESPVPRCGPNDALVRTHASLISPGTERLLIEMGKKGLMSKALARPDLVRLAYGKAKREGFVRVFKEAMARLDTPMPLGYSAAGTVVEIGSSVRGVSVGDRVACSGAETANHAEFISVPQRMCVPFPRASIRTPELSFEDASFVTLGGIALQGIRSGNIQAGETVVVIGLGLIGLITIQILRALGCTVIATDLDESKVRLAQSLGCDLARGLDQVALESLVLNTTGGRGADATLVTAASKDNSPLLLAEALAGQRGRIVLVGVSDIRLTRKAFWDKELTFTVSKASGPADLENGSGRITARRTARQNHEEFLKLLKDKKVRVSPLITHRFPLSSALSAYEMITRGSEPYIGVVLEYAPDARAERVVSVKPKAEMGDEQPESKRVGFIGAGMFTRNFILPAVSRIPGVRLVSIAAATGPSAHHAAKRFGFESATTDYRSVLSSPDIRSVFVMTRHASHGSMVSEGLRARKRVFVEKPLAIDERGLSTIAKSLRLEPESVLMVGFNRRYSSLAAKMKSFFEGRTTPLQMIYRVNAGYIRGDHWTQDPASGGGRIIGEVCHFVDFFQFLTGASPVSVNAKCIAGNTGRFMDADNVSLSIRFEDGSLGTIVYTAMGPKTYSRERIEVFCDEGVGLIEDFRQISLFRGTRSERKKLSGQDMGYRSELEAFFALTLDSSRTLTREAFATTRTTIAAMKSMATGRTVHIDIGMPQQ